MNSWKVSSAVGNVRNNSPELCAVWEPPTNLASGHTSFQLYRTSIFIEVFGKSRKGRKHEFSSQRVKGHDRVTGGCCRGTKDSDWGIYRWNDTNASVRQLALLPIKWETPNTPQLGASAHTVINHPILNDADIVIGIFGPRIGTSPKEYIGGTVEEIKKHVAAGKTAKVYFSEVRSCSKNVDQNQYALVQKFREELNRQRSICNLQEYGAVQRQFRASSRARNEPSKISLAQSSRKDQQREKMDDER